MQKDCCRFHLVQSWWRKIQTVGLSSEYKDKSCKIGKWLSPFFILLFLPTEEIEDCFVEDIMSEAPSDEKYTAFADYVLVCLIFRIIHLRFRLRKEPTMVENLSVLTKNHANEKNIATRDSNLCIAFLRWSVDVSPPICLMYFL